MAALFTPFNKDLDPMRSAMGGIRLIMQGRAQLATARAVIIAQCNGDPSTAANCAEFASLGGFTAGGYADANTAASAAFTQLDSVHAKINAPSGTGDATGAAIDQAAGILGVV